MENKINNNLYVVVNIHKKTTFLLILMKKAWRYWINFKIHRILKGRKVNKL